MWDPSCKRILGGGSGAEACERKAGKARPGKLVCVWNRQTKVEQAEPRIQPVGSCVRPSSPLEMGSTPRYQSIERWTGKGCARCPAQSQAKNQTCRHPGTSGGLCPAPPAAVCLLLQRSRLKRSPGKGTFFPPRGGEEGVGEQPRTASDLGVSPGSLRRASTSLSRQGRGKGTERFRLRAASLSAPPPRRRGPVPVPGDSASGAAVGIQGGGAAVQRELRVRVPWGGGGGNSGRRRVPRRADAGRRGRAGRWSPQGPRSAARRPHTTSSSPWQRRQQP